LLALVIIFTLLLLLFILPVGVDLRYEDAFALKLKIGPLRCDLLPKKKEKSEKPKKEKKNKKPEASKKSKKRPKLRAGDVMELCRIALKALGRFRRSLSIDRLRLYILVAAEDPYDAVLRYGALNAGLGVLAPLAHNALKIRNEDVRTNVDVQGQKGWLELQLIATLQVWEILQIALCAGFAFLSWSSARKKAAKAAENQKDTSQEEIAS